MKFPSLLLGTLLFLPFFAVHSQTYANLSGPIYPGNFAPPRTDTPNTVKVVSYNIHFSKRLDEVIRIFTRNQNLMDADAILLQEIIGDPGTGANAAEELAKRLKMNYVFIPGQIHPDLQKDYGSAILSRWPLADFEKILLPGKHLRLGTQRVTVGASLQVGAKSLRVYSVHLENLFWDTLTSTEISRATQLFYLLAHVNRHETLILGGDFNAVSPSGLTFMVDLFWRAGYQMASSWKTTFKFIPFALDHIYSRNLKLLDYGTEYDFSPSDHAPIWALFIL